MNCCRLNLLEPILITFLSLAVILFGAVYSWIAMMFCAVIFVLAIVYLPVLFELSFYSKKFLISSCVFFVWIMMQRIFFAVNPYSFDLELLKWVAVAFLFLLIQTFTPAVIHRLMAAIVILGVFECFYGVWQVVSESEMILWEPKEFYRGFVTGTYINKNHLAGMLGISLGFNWGLWMSSWGKRKDISFFLAIAFLVQFSVLLQTGSRMGIFSFVVSLILSLFVYENSRKFSKKFLGMIIVLGISLFFSLDVLKQRFIDFDLWIGSGLGRWRVWQDSVEILKDHFWTGIGLGGFQWVFPSYQSQTLTMGWAHAHNDYLELMIELGGIGFFLFVTVIVFFFYALKKCWVSRPHTEKETFLGCGVAAVSFLIHSTADFNFAIPANLFLFTTAVASLVRLIDEKQ